MKHYRAILAALDPRQVHDQLHALAGAAEPVLLCWKKPPLVKPHNWCHRRYVADWFDQTPGIGVAELAI